MILKLPKYVLSLRREMHKIWTTTDQSAYCQIYQNSYKKTMYNRFFPFLEWHHFFFQQKFGFRKNHGLKSCHLVLFNLQHNWISSKRNIDPWSFFKTYKKLCSILLFNLKHSGIRGITLYWLESYLNGRMQKIESSGILSNTVNPMKWGVQPGSNFSPLLFLIYVNDFQHCLNYGDLIMFADDTSVFF